MKIDKIMLDFRYIDLDFKYLLLSLLQFYYIWARHLTINESCTVCFISKQLTDNICLCKLYGKAENPLSVCAATLGNLFLPGGSVTHKVDD